MAKEKTKVLLWFKMDGLGRAGNAYFFTDLRELMNNLLLGRGYYCLRDDDIKNFIYDMSRKAIKITTVEKNYNGNKDYDNENYCWKTKFSQVEDGDYFIRNRVDVNSTVDDFYKMDSNTRNSLSGYGIYCKLEEPRELNQDELETIQESINQANGTINIDSVFNLFGVLCCAKSIWTNYEESVAVNMAHDSWKSDKRERTFLGFDCMGMFDPDKVKEKVEVCEAVAKYAYELTLSLTGCELYIKSNPDVPFVDALMAARYVSNDSVEIRKVMEPTMTLKDLLEMAAGEKEVPNWNNAIKVLLDKHITKATGNGFLDYYLPVGDVTVVRVDEYNTKITQKDFKDLEHCVTWKCGGVHDSDFVLYMWDSTAMTYEMLGDIENFVKVIKNK